MIIGIYFYNYYDMIYTARKLKDIGLRCRIDLGLTSEQCGDYNFILRLFDKNIGLIENSDHEVRILYSGKELLSSTKALKIVKDIKKDKDKVLFFVGDRRRKLSVFGGYLISLSSKGEGYDYLYLPEYLREIWKKEEIILISKKDAILNPQSQVIIFDCQCRKDIQRFLTEYDISLKDNIFVGGIDLIEALYTFIKGNPRSLGNYMIISSSKNPEELSLLGEIVHSGNVESYCLNPYTLLVNPKEEKDRAISFLTHKQEKKNICLSTANNPEDVINLTELAIMLNISVEEVKQRIDRELIETATILVNFYEGIKTIVSFKPVTAFSLAKALGFGALEYNKEITAKWTCLTGEVEEREIDFLINLEAGQEETSLHELLTKYYFMS
ncbi:hypothetical protein ACPWSR_14005 [Alloiococcus sp. CFN-8]|uniref:hypothetical protein n=1 Tax=Alloiococcus sp. CFN-8 TaxID=3416081 RepID=UPI003CF93D1E